MPEPDPHDPEPRDATMERAGADGWDALRRAVRVSGLAVGLLHLPSRRFLELSSRAMSLLGLESADLSRLDVATLSDDPEATSRALDLIAAGILDAYRARRRLRGRDDAPIDSFLSVRVIARETDHSHAVATVTDPSDDARRDLQQSDAVLIVGMIDESQQIESISSECEPILGHPSVEYLLTPLLDIVHPGDVARVLAALEEARASDAQVGVLVRVRDDAEAWRTLRLVINAVGEDRRRFGFALVPVDETAPVVATSGRVGELEERLRRIAREIEATGLIPRFDGLPNPREVPGLEDLSSRQWEVLSRLLSGERVPAIARSMYLSQSTVRNHLATIFRRVGVHSQAELLDRLRPRS